MIPAGDLVALVMAAGKGSRLGGPKALLRWPSADGEVPLAVLHARTWLRRGCTRALIVTRVEVARVLRARVPDLEVVISTAPDEWGPAGSLAAAAEHLAAAPAQRILVTPVDCPPVAAATVALLLAALERDAVIAARPRFGNRGGHPVVARGALLEAYRAFDDSGPPPLRDRLRELGAACWDVAVSDPGVAVDLDCPADLAAWGIDKPRFFDPPRQ